MNTVAASSTAISFPEDPVREKLVSLLASGVGQRQAAMAVGVSDSYVSQLLEDSAFSSALAARSAEKLQGAIQHDDHVESIEAKALKAVETKLPFVRNAMEAARIFQILNSAKKRAIADGGQRPEALGAQQVSIILPRAAQVHIQLNSNNQVTEVSGRSMATLPSRALPDLATDVAVKKKAELENRDAAKARELLDQMAPQKTVIGGVVRVL